MNGLLQRVTSLIRWLGGAALVAWAGQRWGVQEAFWALFAVVLGPGLAMLPGFLVLRFVPTGPGEPAPPLGALLQAWWREVLAVSRVFGWQQPWRERAEPDFLPADAQGPRGMLLLHGYSCNRGLWNTWMRQLRARGVPFIALTLEPAFGSIDRYAPEVERAAKALQDLTGLPPLLVAHSMGGLSARAWWRSVTHLQDRVHRVMTLGTPHRGTWLAKLGSTVNARQMRQDAPWLVELAAVEPADLGLRFDCVYSHCDQVVFPAGTAVLPQASVLHLPARGHLQLVFEPAVFERALGLL